MVQVTVYQTFPSPEPRLILSRVLVGKNADRDLKEIKRKFQNDFHKVSVTEK